MNTGKVQCPEETKSEAGQVSLFLSQGGENNEPEKEAQGRQRRLREVNRRVVGIILCAIAAGWWLFISLQLWLLLPGG